MQRKYSIVMVPVVCAGLVFGGGCAMFRSSVQTVDVNNAKPMDADYDFSDLKWLGDSVGNEILGSEVVHKAAGKPIFVVMGVQNRTSRHIDTKALTDTMRTVIINSGKANFVNESQRDTLLKEQGYQLANCTPETRVHIGKQLGASLMLTGSLVELRKQSPREARVSRKEEVFYQLTVEVTDLETGLIAWTTQKERARSASRPIIGW
jgi:penicillin-binding protein activator